MKIGIDIDDTIVNTKKIANIYIKKYKKELEDILYEDFSNKTLVEFYQRHLADMHKHVEVLPGVVEALNKLKAHGCEIIFITARGTDKDFYVDYDYQGITENMFKENNIPYDKIIYRSFPKGENAALAKIDIFIDDLEKNLDDLAEYGIKGIKMVYDIEEPSKYIKFDCWDKIVEYIIKIGGLSE